MDGIGLVLAGGGGKGAYQIGVWKALRELGLEEQVLAVSGTSVGALNAALFMQNDLAAAERLWCGISSEMLLQLQFDNEESLFTSEGLESLVANALKYSQKAKRIKCYVACKRIDDGFIKYFSIGDIIDPIYKKSILMASAALPAIYPPVEIDGETFVDGGANGDNVPIYPLTKYSLNKILVVHLSAKDACGANSIDGTEVIDLFPSEPLGDFLTGTIDFNGDHMRERINLGYTDALHMLSKFKVNKPKLIPSSKKTVTISNRNQNFLSDRKSEEEVEKIDFKDPALQEKYDKRLKELSSIANSARGTTKVLWDETIAKYVQTMNAVKAVMSQDELKDDMPAFLEKQMASFLSKCATPEFHIALVGAVKAGKSTLINAILGEELASTEVTPETAALTKFRGGSHDSVKISFYNKNEWNTLWKSAEKAMESTFMKEYTSLNAGSEMEKWVGNDRVEYTFDSREELKNEIAKWTSSRSATHYFVKEVEVTLKDYDLPDGVILVDTPGLNDAVEYRSDITKNYIDRANAVFVCVKADNLTGPELATICGVFSNARYNPEKVYVIATQQDSLNVPEADWVKQRAEWLKHLQEPMCFGSRKLAEENLFATSGYFYTLLKNADKLDDRKKFSLWSTAMKFQCMPDQIGERFDELLAFTGIDTLHRRMKNEIISKYKELLHEDIENSYTILKDQIKQKMEQVSSRQKEIVAASSKTLDELQKMQEESNEKLEKAKEDQKELDEVLKTFATNISGYKQRLMRTIENATGGKK